MVQVVVADGAAPVRVLGKPFALDDLLAAVRRAERRLGGSFTDHAEVELYG